MKDGIFGAALTAALIVYFSLSGGAEFIPTSRTGTPIPGASGVVLPGDVGVVLLGKGADPTDQTAICVREAAEDKPGDIRARGKILVKISEEKEQDGMNDMFLAFWHGVAAVLIGEASALCVAAAWSKIKCGRKHKVGE